MGCHRLSWGKNAQLSTHDRKKTCDVMGETGKRRSNENLTCHFQRNTLTRYVKRDHIYGEMWGLKMESWYFAINLRRQQSRRLSKIYLSYTNPWRFSARPCQVTNSSWDNLEIYGVFQDVWRTAMFTCHVGVEPLEHCPYTARLLED